VDDREWLRNAIDKLDSKVDRLDQRLDNVDTTLAKQHEQLENHIFRTELNEENIAMLRDDFKPIQKHVVMISGALKAIGILSVVIGTISGIIEVLKAFKFFP
jgi:septation ring formation regulator EzrA